MTKPANTSWNAEVYDRIGTPMRGWAQQVIDDLGLRGDETVLDAGCGSGSVTFDLLEKLPRGKIYAVDYSAEMIDKLAASVRERGVPNVVAMQASLTDFELPEPVDVVFSNAVFHWIPDDDALFSCLLRAAKPGGRLRAQCGGGNIFARFMPAVDAVRTVEPFSRWLGEYQDGKKYRTSEEAVASMARAAWTDARASTFEAPVSFDREDDAVLYLRTIILRDHVAQLPEDQGEPYVRAVIAEYVRRHGPPFTADYARLDMWARRLELSG
jgi:trans-aconitate 2-methyltransferase